MALHIAAHQGCVEFVLLEAGADKAAKTNGATALPIAVRNGHVEMVRFLLDAGVDKDAAKPNGVGYIAALHVAAQHDHLEVVPLLLVAGAGQDAEHVYGESCRATQRARKLCDCCRMLEPRYTPWPWFSSIPQPSHMTHYYSL